MELHGRLYKSLHRLASQLEQRPTMIGRQIGPRACSNCTLALPGGPLGGAQQGGAVAETNCV
eukprot:5806673-Amphidinium_carterae.1